LRPSLHDLLALLALRLAKRRKARYQPETGKAFYEQFFRPDHLLQYEYDLRAILRKETILDALRSLHTQARVLDIGCGVGYILRLLPDCFKKIGVDYSLSALKLASQQLAGSAALVRCSGYALPFEDNSFDLVTCIEVLEHLEDDAKAVSEISRVLKPGGILIASVPSHYYFPEYRVLMGHYRHYSPESFSELLSGHGMEVSQYLNQYKRFNKLYFYIYVALEGLNFASNCLTRRPKSLYERRVPFTSTKVYQGIVAPILNPLRKLDEGSR
jgi:ubiquinone/menaquinone biosynthesis C-methylase UbiE